MPTPVGASPVRPLPPLPSFEPSSGLPAPGRSAASQPSPPPLERATVGTHEASVAARFVAQRGAATATAAVQSETVDPARDAATQRKLDELRTRFSGPYRVGTESVVAAPMFRMTDGFNGERAKARAEALKKMCERAGVLNAMRCVNGRSDPALLVRVTQVLIDNGKLPAGNAPLADRIKQMQWEWGIGVDCAGYAFEAARSLYGTAGFPESARPNGFEHVLAKMDKRPAESARPGDIIHLDNPKPTNHGHNVVVFSRATLDAAGTAALGNRHPSARSFLADAGPIVAFEVDSSWGAGPDGDVKGGGRRDTWLFNARTREWADFDPTSGTIHRSTTGPQDERPSGSFRPKGVS